MQLRAACTKLNDFCCVDALHYQYHTFQISTKSHQPDINFQKIGPGLVSLFFSFSSFCKGIKVTTKFFVFFSCARWSALANYPQYKKACTGQVNRGHQKQGQKLIATNGTTLTRDPLEEELQWKNMHLGCNV